MRLSLLKTLFRIQEWLASQCTFAAWLQMIIIYISCAHTSNGRSHAVNYLWIFFSALSNLESIMVGLTAYDHFLHSRTPQPTPTHVANQLTGSFRRYDEPFVILFSANFNSNSESLDLFFFY